MSAVKTDHEAKARDLDRDAHMTHSGPDVASLFAARAQVHATLALVEQQRIANLIAYVAKWTDGEVLDVDAEIREALRLPNWPSPAEDADALRQMMRGQS